MDVFHVWGRGGVTRVRPITLLLGYPGKLLGVLEKTYANLSFCSRVGLFGLQILTFHGVFVLQGSNDHTHMLSFENELVASLHSTFVRQEVLARTIL